MSKIETILPYSLSDYEEAAYMLSKYFIERNFEADVIKNQEKQYAYSSIISKQGLVKNLLGSRTVFTVTFSKAVSKEDNSAVSTVIEIEYNVMTDGVIKEISTYLLILPAIRKLADYAKILNLCKKKSIEICEKLKENIIPAKEK